MKSFENWHVFFNSSHSGIRRKSNIPTDYAHTIFKAEIFNILFASCSFYLVRECEIEQIAPDAQLCDVGITLFFADKPMDIINLFVWRQWWVGDDFQLNGFCIVIITFFAKGIGVKFGVFIEKGLVILIEQSFPFRHSSRVSQLNECDENNDCKPLFHIDSTLMYLKADSVYRKRYDHNVPEKSGTGIGILKFKSAPALKTALFLCPR